MEPSASSIVQRIEKALGQTGLVQQLSRQLSPTDLSSLLLEVYREVSSQRTPAQVLQDFQHNRFVQPARISPAALLAWEVTLQQALPPEIETLLLSPVAPLGSCAVVAEVDQNWSVATIRGNEVVSDATNVLALEAASRRQQLLKSNPRSAQQVHLGASHRLLRPQFYGGSGQLPHFNLFCLVSAGRDTGNFGFEFAALFLHLSVHLKAVRAHLGLEVPLRVTITDFSEKPRYARIHDEIFAALREPFPGVTCAIDPERTGGKGYYSGMCFHLFADLPEGDLFLADGGEVTWSQKFLSNRKERMWISGLSGERVAGLHSSQQV